MAPCRVGRSTFAKSFHETAWDWIANDAAVAAYRMPPTPAPFRRAWEWNMIVERVALRLGSRSQSCVPCKQPGDDKFRRADRSELMAGSQESSEASKEKQLASTVVAELQ